MSQPKAARPLVSMALFVVKVVGIALLGYALVMFVAQRWVVFPGQSREVFRTPDEVPPGVEQVWLEPSFGRVEAWFFEAQGGEQPPPTVVFAHGNGELIDDWEQEMQSLRSEGVNALLVEFPGYGFSDGSPSREAMREAFTAAYDWLVEEGEAEPERIVAYGRSLGGGAASDLAVDRRVGALALQSTFTSAAAMARAALLPGFLVRDRFDNRRVVAAFEGPVLLMHGVEDDVIPYEHAEGLASAREDLEVVQIDCAHNDCGSAWPEIREHLTAFLAMHGLLGRGGSG